MRSASAISRTWTQLVMPSARLTNVVDRDRARLLAALLIVLLACGTLSGVIQLLSVADFVATFRAMGGALLGLALAYGLSRSHHYRLAAGLAALLVIAACTLIGIENPGDRVWYAFMLIAVLFASTFLTLRAAIATALLAALAVGLVLFGTGALAASEHWLPPLMLHAVLSPLVLVLSHRRAVVERRRSEELRARESKLLEVRRLETLGQLAGGVAHDLNNLLTVVLGNTYWLLRRGEFDESCVTDIAGAGQQAARLVEQLLSFARGRHPQPQRVDLNQSLLRLRPILDRLKGTAQLQLEREPELPSVEVDPVQFEQVIINLVVNARDAMPDGGR